MLKLDTITDQSPLMCSTPSKNVFRDELMSRMSSTAPSPLRNRLVTLITNAPPPDEDTVSKLFRSGSEDSLCSLKSYSVGVPQSPSSQIETKIHNSNNSNNSCPDLRAFTPDLGIAPNGSVCEDKQQESSDLLIINAHPEDYSILAEESLKQKEVKS